MDGNRRWARERGLASLEGHTAGLEKIGELLSWVRARGIKEVTLYAFSTENWNRSPEEVAYLMKLFNYAFDSNFKKFIQGGGRVRFIGDRARMPEKLQTRMRESEEESKENTEGTLVVALSYGGRAEILAGVNALLQSGVERVDESDFGASLWSAGLLDPDLIIRTGGDMRLSNFLTWQSVYSELFFTATKWPDFSEGEFDSILAEYASRERRLGA